MLRGFLLSLTSPVGAICPKCMHEFVSTSSPWPVIRGIPLWFSSTESTCNAGDMPYNPWVGKIIWKRKWQPTPVFLPGESHGQRSLAAYSPWGCKESNVTGRLRPYNTPRSNDQSLIFNKVLRGTWGKIWIYIQSNLHLLFKMLIFFFFFRMSSNPVQTWPGISTQHLEFLHGIWRKASALESLDGFPPWNPDPRNQRKSFPFLLRAHLILLPQDNFQGNIHICPFPFLPLIV